MDVIMNVEKVVFSDEYQKILNSDTMQHIQKLVKERFEYKTPKSVLALFPPRAKRRRLKTVKVFRIQHLHSFISQDVSCFDLGVLGVEASYYDPIRKADVTFLYDIEFEGTIYLSKDAFWVRCEDELYNRFEFGYYRIV